MLHLTESEYKKRFGKLPPKKKPKIPSQPISELEELLAFQLKSVGLGDFHRQYKFHPDRKWKLDFYKNGWGLEVQGGGWSRGGHNRNAPLSLRRDYEKFNACMEMGIKLLLFTGEQIKDGTAILQIERIFR